MKVARFVTQFCFKNVFIVRKKKKEKGYIRMIVVKKESANKVTQRQQNGSGQKKSLLTE